MTNILQYLEDTVARVPDKVAFANEAMGLTFRQVFDRARALGSFLHREGFYQAPVVVLMRRHPAMLVSFLGVLYAGCYYVPLDEEMPRSRMDRILKTLGSKAMICDEDTAKLAAGLDFQGKIYRYSQLCQTPVAEGALEMIRGRQLDMDPIYIVFTSGSTGVPKGVMACHRSVIDYIEALCAVLRFDAHSVFGSQTPLYFDAYLKEVLPTLKYGATTILIPKPLFLCPVKLVEFLNEHRINTVCWVASALTMLSGFRTFERVRPEYLHTVASASEVFPIQQLNLWRAALPKARFFNLYGPTEATGVCCCYEVDRDFGPEERLPVGRPFRNTEILLLDENDQVPPAGQPGEICVRGTRLTMGYYGDPEATAKAFVQNPLNHWYPETIYRTGDLGRWNDRGELEFLGRKDLQIKHMGHRIELGEIESIAQTHEAVQTAGCVYDTVKKHIILCYVGEVTPEVLGSYLKSRLPRYMVPRGIRQLEAMPRTSNGKIDRQRLQRQCEKAASKEK